MNWNLNWTFGPAWWIDDNYEVVDYDDLIAMQDIAVAELLKEE